MGRQTGSGLRERGQAQWRTHRYRIFVRLPIEAGMVPLSWLLARLLCGEADRLRAERAVASTVAHAQRSQTRQVAY
jgi:hypothetical protein